MPIEEPRAMREVHAWRAMLHQAMEGMSQAERLQYIRERAEHLLDRGRATGEKPAKETTRLEKPT